MKKTDKVAWYAPLLPHFRGIKDTMPLSHFAAVEAVLHLLEQVAPGADPTKAYLLFTQYHLIGTTACSAKEYTLQQARATLGRYRSKKYWQDDLEHYQAPRYDAVRAFSIEEREGGTSFSRVKGAYPYPYAERQKEWGRFWPDQFERGWVPVYAEEGQYSYAYQNPKNGVEETVFVKLPNKTESSMQVFGEEKGHKEPITLSVEELLKTAQEMAERFPGDPCYQVLKTNRLKKVDGDSVQPCTELTIHEVVNMVGMVGAGKSTLIKVLAVWCHQNGYRVAIVVDTVAEVLQLQKYLSGLGVSASPLIGRSERLKYIHQVAQTGDSCLHESFSKYLTPVCLIDGMDTHHKEAMVFGKEPCYTLKKEGKNYLCPYFDQCPGTKMWRECYLSSVVLTTVAGFAASRVGQRRETFLELALREFDLVIFDESDRVQKTLDQFFLPETSFDSYIHECGEECSAYMRMSSKRREANQAMQRYDEMQRKSATVLACVLRSLRDDLGSWKKIDSGDPFSALMLLEDLQQRETDYQIPPEIYHAIYQLIDMDDTERMQQNDLLDVLESACVNIDGAFFDRMYNGWREKVEAVFPRPQEEKAAQIQDARLKLILRLIYFDHFVRELNSAYEASHETSYDRNELFGFLQSRFREQQQFLPSALCGNLFGLKKTEEADIILFRQFAFGRSLMKDLPYLRIDSQGRAAGPHTILLSGSSWAEGSYEYHINRPVNYILEAASEKRDFLKETKFFAPAFLERVSGAPEERRMEELRSVAQKSVESILRELDRNAGKILVVVNSYAQAEEVQRVLETELQSAKSSARVCRMVSDAADPLDDRKTVRRGEVARFADMEDTILIAPAMAIERGHNIVDEHGHSALCAVFFLVRPMAVPDDIRQQGSKLNGFIEAHCQRGPQEPLFEYHVRIRQSATKKWKEMSGKKASGLVDLDEAERKDVVATLFILILQIFGRLARVTDTTRPEPHVYFMDGAFRRREERQDDFDCLSALGQYLETLMTHTESAEIAETLYAPFYKAYRRDVTCEQ